MSAVKRLLPSKCTEDLGKISKCVSAGRNHLPCCQRRGVSATCQPLCQGIQAVPDSSIFTDCLSYVGNVLTCLEEGKSLNSLLSGKLW